VDFLSEFPQPVENTTTVFAENAGIIPVICLLVMVFSPQYWI
jgi:hypothetical protein